MKAFKQINLNLENRIVFSYAVILCFLCSLIVLNPLFGQVNDEKNTKRPKVNIDVQKEYDEDGNIIGYDSTYKWYWSGKELTNFDFDSVFEGLEDGFNDWNKYFDRNHFKQFGHLQHPDLQWNNFDSSIYSNLDNLFDEEFMDQFNLKNEYFPFHDSSITSFFNFDEFDTKFKEEQNDYMDRLKKYQQEHQQLIEKYFGDPLKENNSELKIDQNKNTPRNNRIQSGKSGRI